MSASNLETEELFTAIHSYMGLLANGGQPNPKSINHSITVLNEIQRRFTALAQVEPLRFAIELYGGFVEQIFSDGERAPKAVFAVIDYDIKDVGDDDITYLTQPDGTTTGVYVNFPTLDESGSINFKEIFPASA
jgi:hypothetical protein